jgi:hypothetical protein
MVVKLPRKVRQRFGHVLLDRALGNSEHSSDLRIPHLLQAVEHKNIPGAFTQLQ